MIYPPDCLLWLEAEHTTLAPWMDNLRPVTTWRSWPWPRKSGNWGFR